MKKTSSHVKAPGSSSRKGKVGGHNGAIVARLLVCYQALPQCRPGIAHPQTLARCHPTHCESGGRSGWRPREINLQAPSRADGGTSLKKFPFAPAPCFYERGPWWGWFSGKKADLIRIYNHQVHTPGKNPGSNRLPSPHCIRLLGLSLTGTQLPRK